MGYPKASGIKTNAKKKDLLGNSFNPQPVEA